MIDALQLAFASYTFRVVALGAATLGAVAGALGCFAVLRRQSLLGDAIAHAALPGIGLAFLLTGSRATPVLVLGAAIAGWLGTLAVIGIVRAGRLPEDTALGIVLSVFFGLGLVILTFVQQRPMSSQAGLETFLWGQAATLVVADVALIGGVGAGALLLLAAFWKEFKILTFDPALAETLGLPVRRIEFLLTSLLVVGIVLGLQTVGVVLMSALVVAPAAAARQWTDGLGRMVWLAGALGAVAGLIGVTLSSLGRGIPTGPVIVLAASTLVAGSLFFAPGRGLVAELFRRRRVRNRVRSDAVLADLYALAMQHEGEYGHPLATLRTMRRGEVGTEQSLRSLEADGCAREIRTGQWTLTPEGEVRARSLFLDGRDRTEEPS